MPLNIDQINEQLNAANPGKIAVIFSRCEIEKGFFIYDLDEFNPEEHTLVYKDFVVSTELQARLVQKEISYLEEDLIEPAEFSDDFDEDQESFFYRIADLAFLRKLLLTFYEEQLEFYKDSPYAEVSD